MLLDGEVIGANAAVWLRTESSKYTGGYRRVPPLLAVEVSGQDEGEAELRIKADWYLSHGVQLVWIVLTSAREVIVRNAAGASRHLIGDALPDHPSLPGLHVRVEAVFAQIQ